MCASGVTHSPVHSEMGFARDGILDSGVIHCKSLNKIPLLNL